MCDYNWFAPALGETDAKPLPHGEKLLQYALAVLRKAIDTVWDAEVLAGRKGDVGAGVRPASQRREPREKEGRGSGRVYESLFCALGTCEG